MDQSRCKGNIYLCLQGWEQLQLKTQTLWKGHITASNSTISTQITSLAHSDSFDVRQLRQDRGQVCLRFPVKSFLTDDLIGAIDTKTGSPDRFPLSSWFMAESSPLPFSPLLFSPLLSALILCRSERMSLKHFYALTTHRHAAQQLTGSGTGKHMGESSLSGRVLPPHSSVRGIHLSDGLGLRVRLLEN